MNHPTPTARPHKSEFRTLMGLSVPALKMRVHRARETLRDLLEVYA